MSMIPLLWLVCHPGRQSYSSGVPDPGPWQGYKVTQGHVTRSRPMNPQSPLLTIGGTAENESDELVILG